jgi:hypothetical protein
LSLKAKVTSDLTGPGAAPPEEEDRQARQAATASTKWTYCCTG